MNRSKRSRQSSQSSGRGHLHGQLAVRAVGRLVRCVAVTASLLAVACDEPKKPEPAASAQASAAAEPEKPKKKEAPPKLTLEKDTVQVDYTTVVLRKDSPPAKLGETLAPYAEHLADGTVEARIDRKVGFEPLRRVLTELTVQKTKTLVITTDTRPEYSKKLTVELAAAGRPKPSDCSMVVKILDDRATAAWLVKGGTAQKKTAGMAGPDLSATLPILERVAGRCSDLALIISPTESIEWGLTFDLAAAAMTLDGGKLKYSRVILLTEEAVAGRALDWPGGD